MRIGRIILIFLSLFVLSCSATNSNIRSITAGDVNAYLKQAPRIVLPANIEKHYYGKELTNT